MGQEAALATPATIEFIKQNGEVQLMEMNNGKKVASVPSNRSLLSMKQIEDQYLAKPERVRGTSTHLSAESFVIHFQKFKCQASVLFANGDKSRPEVTGVYNYNASCDVAGWGDHRAVLKLMLSDEWKTWTAAEHKGKMSQVEFATFIENNIDDICAKPDLTDEKNADLKSLSLLLGYPFAGQQEMMALSRGIEVNEGNKCISKIDPATGAKTIVYENTMNDGQGKALKLPGLFLVRLPIFEGSTDSLLAVRLRMRIDGGSPVWFFEVYQSAKAFKEAYQGICKGIAEATTTAIFEGSPE